MCVCMYVCMMYVCVYVCKCMCVCVFSNRKVTYLFLLGWSGGMTCPSSPRNRSGLTTNGSGQTLSLWCNPHRWIITYNIKSRIADTIETL